MSDSEQVRQWREQFGEPMKQLMREVRDERPSGWQAAAAAAIAYVRHGATPSDDRDWAHERAYLEAEAERLVREMDGGK